MAKKRVRKKTTRKKTTRGKATGKKQAAPKKKSSTKKPTRKKPTKKKKTTRKKTTKRKRAANEPSFVHDVTLSMDEIAVLCDLCAEHGHVGLVKKLRTYLLPDLQHMLKSAIERGKADDALWKEFKKTVGPVPAPDVKKAAPKAPASAPAKKKTTKAKKAKKKAARKKPAAGPSGGAARAAAAAPEAAVPAKQATPTISLPGAATTG
jgi:hypothetical protein